MKHAFSLSLAALALTGCSTVDEVVAYGKGPFDHGPLPRSETALEGLHESSWGNSGKWGSREDSDESPVSSTPSSTPSSAQTPDALIPAEPPVQP